MVKQFQSKRGRNGYNFFYSERFPALKRANPNLKVPALAKLAGAEWRGLSEAQKAPYNRLAEASRAVAQRYNEQYKPMRGRNAYNFFYAEEAYPALKDANPDWKVSDIGREAGK